VSRSRSDEAAPATAGGQEVDGAEGGSGARQHRRPLLAGALAAAALGALQAWLLLIGTSAPVLRVDRLLHLALVTAVALSCLAASWRHEGRERVALVLLTGGAQVHAMVQAVHLGHDLLRRPGDLSVWDAGGQLILSVSAVLALWLLAPAPRP
jgi:hypothetical protein